MPDIFVAKKKPTETKPVVKKVRKKSKTKRGFEPTVLDTLESTGKVTAAFCFKPKKIKFETRQRGEKVILLLRKHPITNLKWVILTVLLVLAPLSLNSFPLINFLPNNFQTIAILGWYLVTVAFALENFLTWFFNVHIITDERIVDIDFYNLIYKEVSDANIDKIQDVTYKMGGVARTVFNYGDVIIQTASEVPNLEAIAIPKPALVAKILQDLRIEEEVEKLEGRIR